MVDYNEIYKYYLVKYQVYETPFIITDDISLFKSGFRSLYAISKEDAESISTSSNFSGFKGTVWSPHLSVDVDSFEKGEIVKQRLIKSGLTFKMYESGNKGYHFDLKRRAAPSHLLPQIDREWVRKYIPEADISIYSSLHMFRLEGTNHIKTGIPKALIYTLDGDELNLMNYKLPSPKETRGQDSDAMVAPLSSIFLDGYIMSMTVPHEEGDRHRALLNLGLAMKRKGEPIQFISRWLYHTQLLFSESKPDDEIERILDFIERSDA